MYPTEINDNGYTLELVFSATQKVSIQKPDCKLQLLDNLVYLYDSSNSSKYSKNGEQSNYILKPSALTVPAASASALYDTVKGIIENVPSASSEALPKTSGEPVTYLIIKNSAGYLRGLSGYNNSEDAQFIQVFSATEQQEEGAIPEITFLADAKSNFYFTTPGYYFASGIVVSNSSTFDSLTEGAADCWFNALYN